MLHYFMTSAIVWSLSYLIYILLLRREIWFNLNRAFLLFVLCVGFLLPSINLMIPSSGIGLTSVIELSPIVVGDYSDAIMNTSSVIDLRVALFVLYICGVFIVTSRFIYGWVSLYRLSANADFLKSDIPLLYESEKINLPIYWNGKIILPKALKYEGKELDVILRHERAHQELRHHYDLIILQLCKIFFWFIPPVYLLERELRLVHEYQADARACVHYNRKQYGSLLIQFSLSQTQQYGQAHGIFSHQLKNRLLMLTRKSVTKITLWKYLSAAGTLCLMLAMSFVVTAPQLQAQNQQYEKNFDTPPILAGCESLEGEEVHDCTMREFITLIYKNIVYPDKAIADSVQGTVYLSYVITEEGRIDNVEVLRSPSEEIEVEAVRALKLINEQGIVWIPGKKDGKPIAAKLVLPIQFVLDQENADE